jgi:hypothetical protein
MFFSRRKPNHISGMNFLDYTAFSLNPSAPCRDNQCLSEGMRMPGSTRSRLKGDAGAGYKRWVGCLKKRVNADSARKSLCRTFAGRLRADAFDFHNHLRIGQ